MTQPARSGEVHICGGYRNADAFGKRRVRCSTCEKRTTFFWWSEPWYGPTWTCLACGDRWSDGERLERPFKPRWRQESIASARRMYARLRGSP